MLSQETIAAIAVAAFWVACGFANFGLLDSYFQRNYKNVYLERDRSFCMVASIFGPVALIATLMLIASASIRGRKW